jgi:NAD(P)-dependent dehydrogenase (short-subunit alcohol dehydrogenase family)
MTSNEQSRADRFEGRVAVVTGAGSGMGAAMARGFSAEGASVVAVDVDAAGLERTMGDLGGASDRARAVILDVTDRAAVAAFGADLAARGRVDVLCNNAGVLDDYTPAHETDWELWTRILGVNLNGPYLMAHAIVPTMLAQGKGAIVNTASIAGLVAGGGGAAYTTSKHGLIGFTKQLAFDYGRRGIRANAICPGAIATGMTVELRTPELGNEHVNAAIEATPAGRWGEPEEVAALALFLASDEASFVHGVPVLVDGGWTLS